MLELFGVRTRNFRAAAPAAAGSAGLSAGAHAAEGAGHDRDKQSLDLLLGLLPELNPYWCEGQPIQHSGHATRAKDQLLVFDTTNVCLQHPNDIGTDPIEPCTEPIPSLGRVYSDPRHDPYHGEIVTSDRHRPDHRCSERSRQF